MICPACKNDMIVVEYNRIELDYCSHCKGVWFDSGELELWLKSMGQAEGNQVFGDMLGAPEAQSAEKVRKCPVCRQGMKKVNIGRQSPILIDTCRRGDGLWFDMGEVDLLVKELTGKPAEKPDAQPQVATFLSEVFQGRG